MLAQVGRLGHGELRLRPHLTLEISGYFRFPSPAEYVGLAIGASHSRSAWATAMSTASSSASGGAAGGAAGGGGFVQRGPRGAAADCKAAALACSAVCMGAAVHPAKPTLIPSGRVRRRGRRKPAHTRRQAGTFSGDNRQASVQAFVSCTRRSDRCRGGILQAGQIDGDA